MMMVLSCWYFFFPGDKPNHYGQQRLWGAVGWGLFTLIAGVLIDELSKNQFKKDYTIAFYIAVINILLSIVVSYQLKVNIKLIPYTLFSSCIFSVS